MNCSEILQRAYAPYKKSYNESAFNASAPVTDLNGTVFKGVNNDGSNSVVFTLTFADTSTMDVEVGAGKTEELRSVKTFEQVAKSGDSTDYIIYVGEPV